MLSGTVIKGSGYGPGSGNVSTTAGSSKQEDRALTGTGQYNIETELGKVDLGDDSDNYSDEDFYSDEGHG